MLSNLINPGFNLLEGRGIRQIVNKYYPLHVFEVHRWQGFELLLASGIPDLLELIKILHSRQMELPSTIFTIRVISTPTVSKLLLEKVLFAHLFTRLVLPTLDYPNINIFDR